MKALAVAATLLAVLGTASCGSGPSATPTAASTSTTEAATARPPTSAVDEATVAQWASEIAKLRSSYINMQESWDDAKCSALAVPDAPDCGALLVAMGFTAQTAQITLDGLQKESGPTYLGQPPSEIATLLTETTGAAEASADASLAVSCPGTECASTAFTFERTWGDLGTAFAGWEPYL